MNVVPEGKGWKAPAGMNEETSVYAGGWKNMVPMALVREAVERELNFFDVSACWENEGVGRVDAYEAAVEGAFPVKAARE